MISAAALALAGVQANPSHRARCSASSRMVVWPAILVELRHGHTRCTVFGVDCLPIGAVRTGPIDPRRSRCVPDRFLNRAVFDPGKVSLRIRKPGIAPAQALDRAELLSDQSLVAALNRRQELVDAGIASVELRRRGRRCLVGLGRLRRALGICVAGTGQAHEGDRRGADEDGGFAWHQLPPRVTSPNTATILRAPSKAALRTPETFPPQSPDINTRLGRNS